MNVKKIIITLSVILLTFSFLAAKPNFYNLKYNKYKFFEKEIGFSMHHIPPYFLMQDNKIQYVTEIELLPADSIVIFTPKIFDTPLGNQQIVRFNKYIDNIYKQTFYELLYTESQDMLSESERRETQGIFSTIELKLPKNAIPKVMRNFLGNKAGSLNLDGSQKISILGNSTKDSNANSITGNNTNFNLKMEQVLDLKLRGTVGEKIHVDITHNSEADKSFGSRENIDIEYRGNDDEIVKSITGGNISFSIQGSGPISHSASSNALFGGKAIMQIGDLDITTIICTEEGQKRELDAVIGSEGSNNSSKSDDFVSNAFFVDDPRDLYQTIDDPNAIKGYHNNAIIMENNEFMINSNQNLTPEDNTENDPFVTVVLQKFGQGTEITHPGYYIDDDDTTEHNFVFLEENTDYRVDYNMGIIYLNTSFRSSNVGLAYKAKNGDVIGSGEADDLRVRKIYEKNQTSDDPTWKYSARNIYSIGKGLDDDSFVLEIFTQDVADNSQDLKTGITNDNGKNLTYLEYLQIDSSGDDLYNSIDETINFEQGILFIPFIEPFSAFQDSVIYSDNSPDDDEVTIYIKSNGKVAIGDNINISSFDMVEGSLKIKLGSRTLVENQHYRVDYMMGNVEILDEEIKNSEAELKISYEEKPIFALDSKTMFGTRAEYKLGDTGKLGTTFLYHSKTVQDERPKIGHENRTTVMSGFDGNYSVEIPFLTKVVDFLPLIKTDSKSEISLSGEFAVSKPTIYGRKKDVQEAYIDDMESSLVSFDLYTGYKSWLKGSNPFFTSLRRGVASWFNEENSYKANDIYDNLTDDEGKENVNVLTVHLKKQQLGVTNQNSIMKPVNPSAFRENEYKYLELVARVVPEINNYPSDVTVHFDFGVISEDSYTEFGQEGKLNEEDGVEYGDFEGDLDNTYNKNEDVGLDELPNKYESEAGDTDAHFDDYDNKKVTFSEINRISYPKINFTEDNKQLDSEDLNKNNTLDTKESFIEYSYELGDDNFETELLNGWKLYRIPIKNSNFEEMWSSTVNTPSFDDVNTVRVWFEYNNNCFVDIAEWSLVGNKWTEKKILTYDYDDQADEVTENDNETLAIGIVDNKKNQDHYTPPKNTYKEEGTDNVATLEQAITIDYENLASGNYGYIKQYFQDPIELLSYNKIKFWAYLESFQNEEVNENHELEAIIRLGADSVNYYEAKVPLKQNNYQKIVESQWEEITLDFADFTHVSVIDTNYYEKEIVNDSGENITVSFAKRGSPNTNLNTIKNIFIGLHNASDPSEEAYNGRVYFNDIRVADPFEAVGYAANSNFSINLADLGNTTVSYNWKSQDFTTVTSRNNSENKSFSISNKLNTNKFFPTSWGLRTPLSYTYSKSTSQSRFKLNSDVLVENLPDDEKDHEKNKSQKNSYSFSYSVSKTPENILLEYLFKNVNFTSSYTEVRNSSSTVKDTTYTSIVNADYDFSFSKKKYHFKILKDYKFYYIPQKFENNIVFKEETKEYYKWLKDDETEIYAWERNTQSSKHLKNVEFDHSIDYSLFSDLTTSYSISSERDLMKRDSIDANNYLAGVDLGYEKNRDQKISMNFDPNYFSDFLDFNLSASSDYSLNRKQMADNNSSNNSSEEEEEKNTFNFEQNGSNMRNISGSVTLKTKKIVESTSSIFSKIGSFVKKKEKAIIEKQKNSNDKTEDKNEPKIEVEENSSSMMIDAEIDSPKNNNENEEKLPNEKDSEEDSEEASGKDKEDKVEPPFKLPSVGTMVKYFLNWSDFKVRYENRYKTVFQDKDYFPNFMYQLGIPHQLKEGDLSEKDIISTKNNTDTYTVGSSFQINGSTTLNVDYRRDITKIYTTSGATKEIKTVFPTLSISFNNFHKLFKFKDLISNSNISSKYSVTNTDKGDITWGSSDIISLNTKGKTINFSPLSSFRVNWENDITTNVTYSITQTENEEIGRSVSNSIRHSVTCNADYSFTAREGFSLPFIKKRIQWKNEMTASLDFSYNKEYAERKAISDKNPDVTKNKYNFTIDPSLSYKFSRNISGGLTLNYKYDNDMEESRTLRVFGLALNAEVKF